MSETLPPPEQPRQPNEAQESALRALCHGYRVEYDPSHYAPQFDLPPDYLAGWVGGFDHMAGTEQPTIYVGCDGEGRISS